MYILPNSPPKPVRLCEMASCVFDAAHAYHDLDRARVTEKRQTFPDRDIDRRVHVLEATSKLLDLIAKTPDLIKAVQEAVKADKEKEAAKQAKGKAA